MNPCVERVACHGTGREDLPTDHPLLIPERQRVSQVELELLMA